MKRPLEGIENDLSSRKHFDKTKVCFLDLSDEILVDICRYLSLSDIFYSFYTPEKGEFRLHRLIVDYYNKLRLGSMKLHEIDYFFKLFSDSKFLLRPSLLLLNNDEVPVLIDYFSDKVNYDTIKSLFNHLKCLTLIDCNCRDVQLLTYHHIHLTQIQSLCIINQKIDDADTHISHIWPNDSSVIRLLFEKQLNTLEKLVIQPKSGIRLYQSLTPNLHICYINIYLQTIDDLYILLNGILPNIKIIIVQLCQKRLLKSRHFHFQSQNLSLKLIEEFTLLECSIGFVLDDMKWILGFLTNLNKLTLSIRDTSDPLFCDGTTIEAILNEFIPNLQQFHYTMTHQINENTIIKDFIQWPMNIINYEYENCKCIHIYSLPWPSNKDDKRELPFIKDGSISTVKSDVKIFQCLKEIFITKSEQFSELDKYYSRVRQLTTCLSINIQLPQQISKLILLEEIPESSLTSLIQPSVRYLIVERRLNDIEQISIYARQFPNVKYLKLLLPKEKSLFVNCLKHLFNLDDKQDQRCYWPQLIAFSTSITYEQSESIYRGNNLHLWFIENTHLKYLPYSFRAVHSHSSISIWF